MNLPDEILFFLSQHPGNYRLLRERMLGNVYLEEQLEKSSKERSSKIQRERAIRVALSRLKKKGLVKDNDHLWQLTEEGLKKIVGYRMRKKINPPPTKTAKRQMIIAFDIPESKRKSRYWLRIELVSLGFKMLQKSVWLGPAPLPKEMLDHLKNADITQYLKFFEVKESDIV
ncbi:MAG TPA: hypothetical protein P5274_02800 [Candidatus Paceibacterota bacterium]|nr:hypothetical protein [Candidatus Paceibacterota bacterium]